MLQKLGEQLQQARLARGVSLEDAERIIRIRRKYLAALERGDHLALPTPLQVRGFLQSYSTYIGLDAAALGPGRTLSVNHFSNCFSVLPKIAAG